LFCLISNYIDLFDWKMTALSDRFEVFVGNLTFTTSEDQLRELFAFVGAVKHVRILNDKDSGKSKGFAFVEFFDSNTALAAIKHLDQAELNGRKIKVGFPNQSNLRNIAIQLGENVIGVGSGGNTVSATEQLAQRIQGEQAVINGLKLHEAWDILDAIRRLGNEDKKGLKLRAFVEANPQIISAVYEIERRLGMALPAHISQQQLQQQQLLADYTSGKLNQMAVVQPPPPPGPPPGAIMMAVDGGMPPPQQQQQAQQGGFYQQQQQPAFMDDQQQGMYNSPNMDMGMMMTQEQQFEYEQAQQMLLWQQQQHMQMPDQQEQLMMQQMDQFGGHQLQLPERRSTRFGGHNQQQQGGGYYGPLSE
jgi:hypothetical protein